MRKAWGTVTMSLVYHYSPTCINLKNRDGLKTPCYIVEYNDEQHAFETGHNQPCSLCVKSFTVDDEEAGMVQLTVEQIDTLRAIRRAYTETGKPVALKQVAAYRNRKISTCHRIVNMLVSKGILKKKRVGGHPTIPGSITPTPAVSRILDRLDRMAKLDKDPRAPKII